MDFKGRGLSAFDLKPLAERFGNKNVGTIPLMHIAADKQEGQGESAVRRRKERCRSWTLAAPSTDSL